MNSSETLFYAGICAVFFIGMATAASIPKVSPDPDVLQVLDRLSKGIKELRRPLTNGEVNLLPQGKAGFANTVRCFSDISVGYSITHSGNSRTLAFNLSSVSITDKIVAMQLVLRQAPNTLSYRTRLHEIIGDGAAMDLKLLDSGFYMGEWHTLDIEKFQDSIDSSEGRRNYRLSLSINHYQGDADLEDILHNIKPMLLVYTSDMGKFTGRRSTTKSTRSSDRSRQRKRRSIRDEPSLEELKRLSCRKQVRTMSFRDLNWPGERYAVLHPFAANLSFCYGTCNDPFGDNRVQYNNHAKFISIARPDLVSLGESPCCVPNPKDFTATMVTYMSLDANVTYHTSFPDVTTCICM